MLVRKTLLPHFAVAAAVVLLPVTASADLEEDRARVIEIIEEVVNSESEQQINDLVAKAISDRSKFLDISYVDPNGDGSDSGWNAKYNLKFEQSSEGGFSIDSGRARLNSFALGLDVKGSYSYEGLLRMNKQKPGPIKYQSIVLL